MNKNKHQTFTQKVDRVAFRLAPIIVATTVAACGGGGGGDGNATANSGASPEGAYAGTMTGSRVATSFEALVLDDGQIWAIYGNQSGGTMFVNGFIQGQGGWNNGSFTAAGVKDFGYAPAATGNLSASYVAGQSLSGTASNASGSIAFSGTSIPSANYPYNSPASVADVAGSWTMSSTSGTTITLAIAANGAFTGTDSAGCALSGTLTPRSSGKRVFNVQMSFGASPCVLASQSATGIALYSSTTSGRTQLMVAAIDASRSLGSVAFGLR